MKRYRVVFTQTVNEEIGLQVHIPMNQVTLR